MSLPLFFIMIPNTINNDNHPFLETGSLLLLQLF